MNASNTCTPNNCKKNRIPLSPLMPVTPPYTKPSSTSMDKENNFSTPSTYESPHSDMESPYFTLR